MKKIMAIIVGVVLSIAQLAHAVIIDNGTYTTDTATGLDWLDLTATLGKSYFDVNALLGAGQIYDDWTFAEERQLDTFVFNYTGLPSITDVNTSTNPLLLDGLITMLGQTYTGSNANIYGTKGLVNDLAFGASIYNVKSLERYNTVPIYGTFTQSNIKRDSLVGAYLVRSTAVTLPNEAVSVAEPEALAMFLVGLGILGFAARRKAG